MKLKDALKKFNFLKKLDIDDTALAKVANHLALTLKGSTEIYLTPLAKHGNIVTIIYDWHVIYMANQHRMNKTLIDIENSNFKKIGPRSIAVPWSERISSMKASYTNQDHNHVPKFKMKDGNGDLTATNIQDASKKMKGSSSAGLPFLGSKKNNLVKLLSNFDEYKKRKDPCMLYTRTTEDKKTRNVWGYPFADTLYEMLFYFPLLSLQRTKFYRASLVSPDIVAIRITELIDRAKKEDKILYSVDFAGFDTSVKYQYIKCAFNYIKSCFISDYAPFLDYICDRMCTIGIVTPTGILNGYHGIPSGSGFTNEVDSIIQLGIASTCPFISETNCLIQGDDGAYMLSEQDIIEFEASFAYAGLKLEKSKSHVAKDYIIFCQNLYHNDYRNDDGLIGGIYPTFRALNRILFQERFINFDKIGIKGKDYYGIRCLTILENCKYHPLFRELVRYVLTLERYTLDVSDDSLVKYCTYLNINDHTIGSLNHQYGSLVMGIKSFEAYKIAKEILAEEEFANRHTNVDDETVPSITECDVDVMMLDLDPMTSHK